MAHEDTNNLSSINMGCHFGTHSDATLHFVDNGRPVHNMDLLKLVGDASVVEIKGVRSITASILKTANIPMGCNKLLLKTDNQEYWQNGITTFQENFCSIHSS
jgi:arylformamidase